MTTTFPSLDVARRDAPEVLAQHLERSRQLHSEGRLLMAGAFLDRPGQPISTMAVLAGEVAASEFVEGDPFVQRGLVEHWEIRPWANMLKNSSAAGPG